MAESTIFMCRKYPMVIGAYSVHITKANFSPIFSHENSSLKCCVLRWLILCWGTHTMFVVVVYVHVGVPGLAFYLA